MLGAAAGLVLARGGQVRAAAPTAVAKPPIPFESVGPFREDADNVFGFFLFTCPFCREHMGNIQAWGETLPTPLRFASIPIPQEASGLQGARAYYAVRRAAPERLGDFERTLYAALHDAHAPADDEKTYLAAARTAGIDAAALKTWWQSKDVRRDVLVAKLRFERYAIEYTPSLALGGRYVLNPELTHGNYGVMLNLANGIISQMLPQFAKRP
jgi:thiol:disulfide interchange protein DsbA